MLILAHRGCWQTPAEKNTRTAFERSFTLGFGTETDVRDLAGQIVISHDMPRGGELTFAEVLQIMDRRNLPLAINIKADGLADQLLAVLRHYRQTNYFTFDMSIPDLAYQVKKGLPVFTGLSDLNPAAPLLAKCPGVWLDAFDSLWYTPEAVKDLLRSGKRVCIVSEDLHQRDNAAQWKMLKTAGLFEEDNLLLCTDQPQKA
ncbi:MAG: phosphodiesterase, partial [Candidatus Margulisbacteria bacterium]|nr:phosphodiesterase [Candidatus Margulisiibacteriota bacterium]